MDPITTNIEWMEVLAVATVISVLVAAALCVIAESTDKTLKELLKDFL